MWAITYLAKPGQTLRKKSPSLISFPPFDRQRAITDLKNAVGGRSCTGAEYLLKRIDGSTIPALIYWGKIVDPDAGGPAWLREVIINLTERKKEARALHESSERLELALKTGDFGFWDVDMRTLQVKNVYE